MRIFKNPIGKDKTNRCTEYHCKYDKKNSKWKDIRCRGKATVDVDGWAMCDKCKESAIEDIRINMAMARAEGI